MVEEHTNYFELLQTCGNTHLNKMMLTFATLTDEMNELSRIGANKFINPLLLYREEAVIGQTVGSEQQQSKDETKPPTSEASEFNEYRTTAQILPFLMELICFLRRCYEVISNVFLQKHSLLSYANVRSSDKSLQSSIREVLPDLNTNVRFDIVWESLANLCLTLINLDEVFSHQSTQLRNDILTYKRSLEMVSKNLGQFSLDSKANDIQTLLVMIEEVKRELIDGSIAGGVSPAGQPGSDIDFFFFRGLVNYVLNTNISENGALARNVQLNENIVNYLKQASLELEHDKFANDRRLAAVVAFYGLYFHLFWKEADRKSLKLLTDLQKKLGTLFVHLAGNVNLAPDMILVRMLPKQLLEKKTMDQLISQREALLKTNLDQQIRQLYQQVTLWLTNMEESFNSGFYNANRTGDTLELIFEHVGLLNDGFDLIRLVSNLIRNAVAVHFQFNKPVSVADTRALAKAINLLKGVQRFFITHKKMMIEVTRHYQKYTAIGLLKILTRTKTRMMENAPNDYSERRLDLLSALILAANCLNGPVLTSQRYTLTSLCLSYTGSYVGLFAPEDVPKVSMLLRRIRFFINIFGIVGRMFNCEFLYFNRAIMQVYFQSTYDSCGDGTGNNISSSLKELQYFFLALDDAILMLETAASEYFDRESRSIFVDAYIADILSTFQTTFIDTLCKDFEDELRLRTHAHLQVADKSPFKRRLKDFHSMLAAEPFKIGGGQAVVWLRAEVENYLNKLAYNMTAIALHDWKTYEAMLGLAQDKFGLEFASLQLPTQTLEQGLDVLQITRNIQIFVAGYMYNLNNQFFIERSSANKHLNVLTITHVANSIQTHGFGIINSTVNYAYQFLKKKIRILSQFLFEEHIRSKLIKEIRHFRELMATTEESAKRTAGAQTVVAKFPFEKAEKFARGIRKLGMTKEGQTYLDKFRQVLTEVGNVLGFIRMIRSGALHCTAEIANFVPDLDDLGEFAFEQLVNEESGGKFGPETVEAAKNFDSVLQTVATNFSESTDFFKLLVDVFEANIQVEKNLHLKNYFVILPATTYNYVENMIIAKEKLVRKNRHEGAAFTDDGFAMGAIYMLRVLGQLGDYDSLQWPSSVEEHLSRAIQRTKQQSPSVGVNTNDKVSQTKNLTLKRQEMLLREFQLLNFNMTSCRILFKS